MVSVYCCMQIFKQQLNNVTADTLATNEYSYLYNKCFELGIERWILQLQKTFEQIHNFVDISVETLLIIKPNHNTLTKTFYYCFEYIDIAAKSVAGVLKNGSLLKLERLQSTANCYCFKAWSFACFHSAHTDNIMLRALMVKLYSLLWTQWCQTDITMYIIQAVLPV